MLILEMLLKSTSSPRFCKPLSEGNQEAAVSILYMSVHHVSWSITEEEGWTLGNIDVGNVQGKL